MDFSAMTAAGPIQPVNPADLRAVWELMQETRAKFLEKHKPKPSGPEPSIGISDRLLAGVCSPEANGFAVWLRCALLGLMVEQGLLTQWQRGAELDDAVFNVAATFPIAALKQFNPDAFLQQLNSRGA